MTDLTILMIATSQAVMGDAGTEPTGVWFEELSTPYYAFVDAGADVTLASIDGGTIPIDPRSQQGEAEASVQRFQDDPVAMQALEHSLPIEAVDASRFDAVFLPGGHGTMWDLPHNERLGEIIRNALADNRPVAAVCHGPAGLVGVNGADGQPLVHGKRVAAFTNSEEEAVGLTDAVPFLLEDALREAGATVVTAPDFQPHVVTDGLLVTGQNPASAEPAAEALLTLLRDRRG